MESFVAGMGVGLFSHLTTLYLMNWPFTAKPLSGAKSMVKVGFGFMMFDYLRRRALEITLEQSDKRQARAVFMAIHPQPYIPKTI